VLLSISGLDEIAPGTGGVTWRIFRTANAPAVDALPEIPVWTGSGRATKLFLSEGPYVVEASFGLAAVRSSFSVAKGEKVQQRVAMPVASIAARAFDAPGGRQLDRAFFTLHRRDGATRIPVGRSSATTAIFHLLPGDYSLEATSGLAKREITLTAQAGKVTAADIALNTGSLEIKTFAAAGLPRLVSATHNFYPAQSTGNSGMPPLLRVQGGAHRIELPAGSYRMESVFGSAVQESQITVTAGQITSQSVILNLGEARVAAASAIAPGAAVSPMTCAIAVAGSDPNTVPLARASGLDIIFPVKAGVYTIACNPPGQTNAMRKADVEVRAGETQTAQLAPW
jgi:hypothetical protein